jgi:hypothetical protein
LLQVQGSLFFRSPALISSIDPVFFIHLNLLLISNNIIQRHPSETSKRRLSDSHALLAGRAGYKETTKFTS